MINCVRLRFVVLALMVTVSHVALVSHVTAHFEPALEHCELCVSQAQPLAAIPADTQCAISPSISAVAWPVPEARPAGSAYPAPYLQRAPPLSSS
jgi:hypothetical protein